MTTNSYFESNYTAKFDDQVLYEDLIIESIQIHGRNMYYLPRTLTNFDKFFGEDAQSEFNEAIEVEMYLENIQGWEGEQSFISKFGMEIHDEATLVVSKKRFLETVGEFYNMKHPNEGDIIVFPREIDYRFRAFEISWVDDEPTFYQLGKLQTFRLKVRAFEYNGEEFNTGISDIDSYNHNYQHSQKIQLSSGVGAFIIGESVTQGDSFTAVCLGFDESKQEIVLSANKNKNAAGYNPSSNLPLVGLTSQATWMLEEILNDTEHVPISDNEIIAKEAPDFIVKKESNPYRA